MKTGFGRGRLAIVLAFHLLIVLDKQNTFPRPIQSLSFHVYILFHDNIFFVSRFHCLSSELSLHVFSALHCMHTCVWEISWPFRNRGPASDRAVIAIFQCSEIKRKRAVFECFVVFVPTVHAIKQRVPCSMLTARPPTCCIPFSLVATAFLSNKTRQCDLTVLCFLREKIFCWQAWEFSQDTACGFAFGCVRGEKPNFMPEKLLGAVENVHLQHFGMGDM